MLSIRLVRVGRKNQPHFRITVADKRFDPRGKYLEVLGFFNPRDRERTLTLKEDRIKYWLEKGAEATPTVHNILVDKKTIPGPKKRAATTHKSETNSNPEKIPTESNGASDQNPK